MSVLFERAIRGFSPGSASRVRISGDGPAPVDGETAALDYLARLVANRSDALAHPGEGDRACVPLHDPDSAELSGECVGFERHPIRGDVFLYGDAETGEDELLGVDDAAGTALASRLRFWLPDFTPDEPPSYARDGPSAAVPPANQPPADGGDGYFDRLAAYVADEREAERRRNRERARRSTPRELFERGEAAIPELAGCAALSDGTIQCRAAADSGVDVRDEFGVFADDEVLLHAPSGENADGAPADFPVPATVERIAGRAFDLTPKDAPADPDALARFLDGADGVGLSSLLNPTAYDREAEAIRTVRNDDDRRGVVVGARDAEFADPTAAETRQRDGELDGSQAFAAAAGLYAEDVCCIHGPPGTGKTRVLVEIVRRTVAAGGRVLVCADSNQGVDNVLLGESTRDDLDRSSLHYFASAEEEFSLDRHREYHSDRPLVREEYDDSPRRPDVVATTNNSAADLPDDAFDLAVVDEATQATAPSTLIPYTKADALVLAGDHKQLPPYDATEHSDDDRYCSLFEHLYTDDGVYGSAVGVPLAAQYRMHPEVAAFPNEAFYDGRLENGAEVPAVDDLPPVVGVDVTGHEREDETGSHSNPSEANAVRGLVERLLDTELDGGDVGVITPYEAQRSVVRSELESLSAAGGVTVDTVDSFQGGERAAVVVSFVRSNDRGDVGFLGREEDGARRLNVALTRAERFCGLVGDWDTLRDGGDGRNACAELYRDLYGRLAADDRMRDEE